MKKYIFFIVVAIFLAFPNVAHLTAASANTTAQVGIVARIENIAIAWGIQLKNLFFKQKGNLAAAALPIQFAEQVPIPTADAASIAATSSAQKATTTPKQKTVVVKDTKKDAPAPAPAPTSTPEAPAPTPVPTPVAPVLPDVTASYDDYSASPTEVCLYRASDVDGNSYYSSNPAGENFGQTTLNIGTFKLDNRDDVKVASISFKITDPNNIADLFTINADGTPLFSSVSTDQTKVNGNFTFRPYQNYDVKLAITKKNELGYPNYVTGQINVEIDSMTLSDGRIVKGLPLNLRQYEFVQDYDYNDCIN